MKNVICLACNWVHCQVSKEYVDKWEADWVIHWSTLTPEGRDAYGVNAGPPSSKQYLRCFLCSGPHTNFRDALDAEIPYGSTIQPILDRDAELEPINKHAGSSFDDFMDDI